MADAAREASRRRTEPFEANGSRICDRDIERDRDLAEGAV